MCQRDYGNDAHLLSAEGEVITLGKELLAGNEYDGYAITGADRGDLWLAVGSGADAVAFENGRPVIRHELSDGYADSHGFDCDRRRKEVLGDVERCTAYALLVVGSDGKLTATTMASGSDRKILTTAGTDMCITVRGADLGNDLGSCGVLTGASGN